MKRKIQQTAIVVATLALVLSTMSLPTYAQPTVNWRLDKAAYAPGDSGTLTIEVINTSGSGLTVRNVTVYYPWAGYDINGKWLANANFTNDFSPVKSLSTTGANNFSYTTPTFNIPSWWGINSPIQFGCPGNTSTRLGRYSACILFGTNSTNRYEGTDFRVTMAQAFYNPSTLSTVAEWAPVASLVVLIIATFFLAMAWDSLRKLPKKQGT